VGTPKRESTSPGWLRKTVRNVNLGDGSLALFNFNKVIRLWRWQRRSGPRPIGKVYTFGVGYDVLPACRKISEYVLID